MKIAVISNHKDNSGYSQAARGYIDALDKSNVELATRHVNLIGSSREEIISGEDKSFDGIDACLQITLPHFFCKSNAKNIGLFFYEASKLPKEWVDIINRKMDGIIVSNRTEQRICEESGVKKPVHCINPAIEIPEIKKGEEIGIKCDAVGKDTHVFYTIATFNHRKNLPALILSYLSEFNEGEDVILFMHIISDNGDFVRESLNQAISHVKKGLKLDNYPRIIVSTKIVPDDKIFDLHCSCDTYCCFSHNESWCIPLFTAIALGNNVVTTPNNGVKEYFQREEYYADAVESPILGMETIPEYLYRGDALWYNVNIMDARRIMRSHYENGKVKSERDDKFCSLYTSERIGLQLSNAIKDIVNGI